MKTTFKVLLFILIVFGGRIYGQIDTVSVDSTLKISDTQGNFLDTLDDEDHFGYPAAIGDLNGDGVMDLAIGAHLDDGGGGYRRGAVYILFMNDTGTVDSSVVITHYRNGMGALSDDDRFGSDICPLGDLDGDGYLDIAVGAKFDDDGGTNTGSVYILFLDHDGTVKWYEKINDTDLSGVLDAGDTFGVGVTTINDINGDSIRELVVGANGDDDGGPQRGAFYVIFYNDSAQIDSVSKVSDTQGNFNDGLDDVDLFGFPESIGDLNGNGVEDLAIGSDRDDDNGYDAGGIWILFMDSTGTVDSTQKISETYGDFGGTVDAQDFWCRPSLVGDLNDDGIPEIAIGTGGDDDGGTNTGAIWLLYMGTDGKVDHETKLSETSGYLNLTLDDYDNFGGLNAFYDRNGDGIIDCVASAINDDDGGSNHGAVYLLEFTGPEITYVYSSLSETYPSSYVDVSLDDTLRFVFNSSSHGDTLNYKIYDDNLDDSGIGTRIVNKFGYAEYKLDLSGAGLTVGDFYLMEVYTEEDDTWYLRFKF